MEENKKPTPAGTEVVNVEETVMQILANQMIKIEKASESCNISTDELVNLSNAMSNIGNVIFEYFRY